jgi:hypothetical protein
VAYGRLREISLLEDVLMGLGSAILGPAFLTEQGGVLCLDSRIGGHEDSGRRLWGAWGVTSIIRNQDPCLEIMTEMVEREEEKEGLREHRYCQVPTAGGNVDTQTGGYTACPCTHVPLCVFLLSPPGGSSALWPQPQPACSA